MCEICEALNIPKRLHTDDRPLDQSFANEKLYRRFNAEIDENGEWIKENKLSSSIFPISNDSCNRAKYSSVPEDVLYNTSTDSHFSTWGVLEFDATCVKSFNHHIPDGVNFRVFKADLVHSPTQCMYPHCEILIYENEQITRSNNPKSVKSLLRDLIVKNVRIVKMPGAVSAL